MAIFLLLAVAMPAASALRMSTAVGGEVWVEGQLRDALHKAFMGQNVDCHRALTQLQAVLPSVEATWEDLQSAQAPDSFMWNVMQNSTVKQVADNCQTTAPLLEVLVWLLFVPEIGRPAASQVIETLGDLLQSPWRNMILRRVQEAMLSGDWGGKRGARLLARASCSSAQSHLNYDGLRLLVRALIFRKSKRAAVRLGSIAEHCKKFSAPLTEVQALFSSLLAVAEKEDFKAVLDAQLRRLAARVHRPSDAS